MPGSTTFCSQVNEHLCSYGGKARCQERSAIGENSDLPGKLQSPIAKREPRLRDALQHFVDHLTIVRWEDLATKHATGFGKMLTNSFAVIVIQEGQSRSDDIERPDV